MQETGMIRWRDVYREAELYKAAVRLYTKPLFNWRKALSTSHDRRTLHDFARHGLQNLNHLHRLLEGGNFRFRPGIAAHHNFNGKHRTLYVYPWEERLVDLLLYRLLNRRLNAWFAPQSYAYRLNGMGVDVCQRRVARLIDELPKPLYVVKRDIADYFASVDHAVLTRKLAALVEPDDCLGRWLQERVAFRYYDNTAFAGPLGAAGEPPSSARRTPVCRDAAGSESPPSTVAQAHAGDSLADVQTASKGIPFGTAIACFFANVYLTDLDRRLGAIPGLHFFRYADDLLVVTPDPAAADRAAATIDDELSGLNLRSKPSHELNLALADSPHVDAGFDSASRFRYLGLEFRADGSIGLSRDKTRKICNLFRYEFRRRAGRLRQVKDVRKRAAFVVSLASKVVNEGFRNVAIIDYYLRHVDDERQLSLIDRWLAEEVVSLACGGGHRKGHFRTLSFRELRRMGLPSLVHRRRLLKHGYINSSFFIWQNRNGTQSGSAAARAHAGATPPDERLSLRTQKQQSDKTL